VIFGPIALMCFIVLPRVRGLKEQLLCVDSALLAISKNQNAVRSQRRTIYRAHFAPTRTLAPPRQGIL